MGKDDIKGLADSMIARFDQQEGLIISHVSGVKKDVSDVKKDVSDVRKDVSDVKRDISAKIDEISSAVEGVEMRVTENEKKISTNFDELHSSVKDAKKLILNEVNEIEAKRPNLIIFGIPESSDSNEGSPREMDIKAAGNIFEALVGVKKPFDLRYRIGKKKDTEKPRPILIRMADIKDKDEILGKAHNLKDHPLWKKAHIKPDLTPIQREHLEQLNAKLSSDAHLKNAELKNEDWKWVVRGRGMERHLFKSKNNRA